MSWGKKNYRDMPWRRTHDPYRILVSEIMLQQTGVERVRTKYTEFIKSFPIVAALASAPLGSVLRVWSGLGYNRRAKFLHEAARMIIKEYEGKFPRDMTELRRLSGIGLSTAAAVSSFAFGKDEPMIDTNVRRILARVFFPHVPIPSDKELYAFAKGLIPKGKGRQWNYALLDIGAMECLARGHKDTCPLQSLHGPVADFIYKKPQSRFKDSRRYYRGRIIALLRENPEGLTEKFITKHFPHAPYDLKQLCVDLNKEGLIEKNGVKYKLP